ncbi:MAG TPA: 50S ribosomal protein L11 methyltransferase [Thermoanaerobaculia bacterium]|nr:50S ribosomal protein L11 methyltransferase [Thermoanaerobaculia bacterium]
MATRTYSRLIVPERAADEAVLGIVSLFAPLGFIEEGADLVACFRDAEDARRAGEALSSSRIASSLDADVIEDDPLAVFRAASRPFPVGRRFWLDPGEPPLAPAPAGRVGLFLPASTAFGTGGHESTRLALESLEDQPLEGADVLDVGTGSGVLALAAAALGARRAVGLDTDDEAVFVARENLSRHPFGARVCLLAGPVDAVAGDFALVVANMLPAELLPLSDALTGRVAPAGRLLISGIPQEEEAGVLARFGAKAWAVRGRRAEGEWVCLCLERAS